jgi:chromosome segregation ATPase
MKTAIKGLLATVRLAPASQVEHLAGQAQRATVRVSELEERMAKLRADVETWKSHHEASAKTAAEWKHAASVANVKTERSEALAKHLETSAEEWKARALALKKQRHSLRERLSHVNHATTLAREHLMATEVKLDLIEAAIQVLDTRTRKTASRA